LKEEQGCIKDAEEEGSKLSGKLMLYYRRILDPHLHTKSIDAIIAELPEAKTQTSQEVVKHQIRKNHIIGTTEKEVQKEEEQILSSLKKLSKHSPLSEQAQISSINSLTANKIQEHIFILEGVLLKRRELLKEEEERHGKALERLLWREKELESIASSIAQAITEGNQASISKKRELFLTACRDQKIAWKDQLEGSITQREDKLVSKRNELVEYENILRAIIDEIGSEIKNAGDHCSKLRKDFDERTVAYSKALGEAKLDDKAQAYFLILRISQLLAKAHSSSQDLPSAANYSKNLERVLRSSDDRIKEAVNVEDSLDKELYSSHIISDWAKEAYPADSKIADAIVENTSMGP